MDHIVSTIRAGGPTQRVTPSYVNAYTCTHDLFIGGGGIYLAIFLIRYGIFHNKGKCLYNFNTPY